MARKNTPQNKKTISKLSSVKKTMSETHTPTTAKVSVIIAHWAQDAERSETMRMSLTSLFQTAPNAEIFIVDNGGSLLDSQWLLEQASSGFIACYIRNRNNMHFGYARNQALKLCEGEYIVIADNDILFQHGWLEECIAFLERNPGKYIATPIAVDQMNTKDSRWNGSVDGWRLNYRAGSNCFVMRRSDWEEIGFFEAHRLAGSLFCNKFVKLGYCVAVMPKSRVVDMGFRKGFNFKVDIPFRAL